MLLNNGTATEHCENIIAGLLFLMIHDILEIDL